MVKYLIVKLNKKEVIISKLQHKGILNLWIGLGSLDFKYLRRIIIILLK